jgi:arylsulfatase A-like enzyme
MPPKRKPNIVFIGIDSLRADRLSCYGYHRLTTPHIDQFALGGTLFERTYSPFIPTTSGYGSMLTGMDVISTQMVALRHQGPLRAEVQTPRREVSISTSITPLGAAGMKAAAPKRRISMRLPSPS